MNYATRLEKIQIAIGQAVVDGVASLSLDGKSLSRYSLSELQRLELHTIEIINKYGANYNPSADSEVIQIPFKEKLY